MNAYGDENTRINALSFGAGDDENRKQWEAIAKARQELIDDGIVPEPGGWLQSEVIESWLRCRDMNINPDTKNLATPLSDDDFNFVQETYADLRELARPLLRMIEDLGLANDYIFELVSRNGVTVLRTGNMDLHSVVAKNGAMNEATMGTNAHTLCMKYGRPVKVQGPQHYASALHAIAATAAPIFNKDNAVIGSLLLTQPLPENPWSSDYQKLLSHALGFIASIAAAMEHQLMFQSNQAILADVGERLQVAMAYGDRAQHVLDAAIDSSGDPILILDSSGVVQHASPDAVHLLRTTMAETVGKDIQSLLGLEWPDAFSHFAESPGRELAATVGSKLFGIRGNAVRGTAEGSLEGFVLRISEVTVNKGAPSRKSGEIATITFEDILGTSAAIGEAIALANRYAMTQENVLIVGESGTGKEYFAQAIHNASRPAGPFMSVNCAAIPPRLIESELFGYESGAFTGADRSGRPGKIELADGGTLFLDEIGDMPLELQATLLRVLENKSVMRLGGKAYRKVDFRVIAATNRSLPKMVEEGLFREDLLYRLSILAVSIPPLRMRNGDTMFFANYFLNECRRKAHEGPLRFTPAAERILAEFPWPGNVRQIKNAIYSAFYAAEGEEIDVTDLPQYLRDGNEGYFAPLESSPHAARAAGEEGAVCAGPSPEGMEGESSSQLGAPSAQAAFGAALEPGRPQGEDACIQLPREMLAMDAVEESAIRLALTYAGGNVAQAAEILQISKATLYRKIKEYGLRS